MLCEALHNEMINLFLNGFNVQPYFVSEDLLLVWQENIQKHFKSQKTYYLLTPFILKINHNYIHSNHGISNETKLLPMSISFKFSQIFPF